MCRISETAPLGMDAGGRAASVIGGRSTTATVTDIASGQSAPSGLAVDDKSVYWSNQGIYENSGGSASIMKAPR